jgi:DNA-binding transcriptional LysR family regulator
VSLSQIQYFVAVAEEGHVGRAALGLRIAQPAVSRQIRRLEEELGTALFVRTPRGMKLSSPGELFLEHARTILGAVSAAERDVRRLGSSGRRGAARRRSG